MSLDNDPDYEYSKLQLDFIKHVSSLSTGSILLITIFLEKIFPQPRFRGYVAMALIGFLISVVSGIVVFAIVKAFPEGATEKERKWAAIASIGMLGGFLIGVISLTGFAILNLFSK